MDNSTSPKWRTNWQEFEAWLDSLDFESGDDNNAHVASISTEKGLYWVTVGSKRVSGKSFLWSDIAARAE